MSNVYYTAIVARTEVAIANDCSASNKKKLEKLQRMLASDKLAVMLADAEIDAERFTRAIYACEKVVKFASQAVALNARELNENTYAIFRTAINCYVNDVTLTKTMIEASISKDVEISDDVKHVVYRRNVFQTVETINAQSQTSIDALVTLNIIKARADVKNAYSVNLTALAQELCKSFEITCEKAAVEEAEEAAAA